MKLKKTYKQRANRHFFIERVLIVIEKDSMLKIFYSNFFNNIILAIYIYIFIVCSYFLIILRTLNFLEFKIKLHL